MPRHNTDIRATQRRLIALWTLIDNGRELDHIKLNESASYCDPRVLLLSMAECALHGLTEITDGKIRITDKGVVYAQEYLHTIKDKNGERITWDYYRQNS